MKTKVRILTIILVSILLFSSLNIVRANILLTTAKENTEGKKPMPCIYSSFSSNPPLNWTFIAYLDGDSSQKTDAALWAQNKTGKRYQNIPSISKKGSYERWYDTELVWAAYYNQGIDIDQNGWEKIKPVPNDNVPKFFRNLWERVGWEFAYVDCDDTKNSENTTQRLPLL